MTYCLTLLSNCDWSCSYCIRDTHNNDRKYIESIELAKELPENSVVALSGGEPGLLSTEKLQDVVDILKEKNCYIKVKSNGRIFNHPSIIEQVDEIVYHCSQDFNIDDVVNKQYPEKTNYLAVVTNDNIYQLNEFIEKHSDIKIMIQPAFDTRINNHIVPGLSKSNLIILLKKYKRNVILNTTEVEII